MGILKLKINALKEKLERFEFKEQQKEQQELAGKTIAKPTKIKIGRKKKIINK